VIETRYTRRNPFGSLLGILRLPRKFPPEIDRILLMHERRIIADGPKADLLTEPILTDPSKPRHLTHKAGFHHAW
jgi:hypothetical protein